MMNYKLSMDMVQKKDGKNGIMSIILFFFSSCWSKTISYFLFI